MSNNNSQSIHLKKEILARIIEAFLSDDYAENTRLIPYAMRPKGAEVPYRCCVYKERAILEERIKIVMGGDKSNPNIIEVIDIACKNVLRQV